MRFNFWAEWPTSIKNTFLLFGFLFFASIIYVLFTDAVGYSNVLDWQITGQLDEVPVTITILDIGPFQFLIPENNYLITESFVGGELKINLIANYSFLVIIISSMILGITSTTFLPKLWYFVFNIIFVLILAYFKFDQLLVFGLSDNTLLIVIIVSYLGLSYLYNALQTQWGFPNRLKAFAGLTILWGVLIYFFAEVDKPFLLLAANGFLVPYIIGMIFILMVSHEILHFIVISISRPGLKSGNNLTRFTLFSFIYLANVTILLLYDTHVIDWEFYYLNPYVLLSFSAILGLWGLQTRKELFKSVKHFPILVLIYLVMGLFCFGSIFYFLGNTNDAILQAVKDAIIYSHFGFGAIFFLYIILNFMGMLRANMNLEKVIYKPKNLPHFTFRFAGLMVVLGFALKENIQVPLFQSLSGMFNNVGDYYRLTNDLVSAESFYENGKLYGYNNHKSNYSLAKIYEGKNEISEAVEDYTNATQVRPSEMAFVNLSRLLLTSGDIFSSHFILSDGQKVFQKSSAILNNKAVLFGRMNLPDSALIYFDAAYRSGTHNATPPSNYLGVLARHGVKTDPDSIIKHYNVTGSPSAFTNSLVLKTQNEIFDQIDNVFRLDSLLSIYSVSYAINYITNQYKYIDSTLLNNVGQAATYNGTSRFSEPIRYAVALANFRNGFVNKSIESLQQLTMTSINNPDLYFYTLGLLMMELQDMDQAVFYFESAYFNNYPNSEEPLNIARLHTKDADKARIYWNNLAKNDSLPDSEKAKYILKILNSTFRDYKKFNDDEKILFVRWKVNELESEKIKEVFNSISSLEKRFQLGIYLIKHFHRKDRENLAIYFRNLLITMENIPKEYSSKYLSLQMNRWVQESNFDSLEYALSNNWIPMDQKLNFEALLALDKNDSNVNTYFASIQNMNAFNEQATITSARYFSDDRKSMRPYNILINALRINPKSITLLKAYVRESINQNLSRYALDGLKTLHQLVDIEEYNQFIAENRVKLEELYLNQEFNPAFY